MTIVVPFKQIDGSVKYKIGDQLLNQDDYTAARTYMGGVTTVNPTPEEELADITRQFESKLENDFAASGAELDESAMTKLVNDSQVEAKKFLGLETQVATPAIQAATPKSNNSSNRMAGSSSFKENLDEALKPYKQQERTDTNRGIAVGNDIQEYDRKLQEIESKIRDARGDSKATKQIITSLRELYGYGAKQAKSEVENLQIGRNKRLSETEMGIPNARADERLALLALNASGIEAEDWNKGDPINATDLMMGEAGNRKGIDVNRQFGNNFNLPIFQKLSDEQARFMTMELARNPNIKISELLKEFKTGRISEDKLMHTIDPAFNPNPSRFVRESIDAIRKDYLISSNMQGWQQSPKEKEIFKFVHGPYNPTAGKDIDVIDLNWVRENVLGRSLNELRADFRGDIRTKVSGGKTFAGEGKNKLNLVMPRQSIIQMGEGGLLDRNIVSEINKRRNWGRR